MRLALPPYSPTHHQLEVWLELLSGMGDEISDHSDEFWKDLPPEVCEVIHVLAVSFRDARNTVAMYLGVDDEDDTEEDDD
jgi:hypothetical protein